jgi:methyl-accepting chemotaxis protein
MGLGEAFDNRSLRTKIGTAVLTATVSGLIVGGLAIRTVHSLNADSAAARKPCKSVYATA